MNKQIRVIGKNMLTNEVKIKVYTLEELVKGKSRHDFRQHIILYIDRDTGLKDVDGNPIFENDKLFSDELIKPITVTYDKEHGLWTDNTYTEELWKSIQKFELKVVGSH